MTIDSLRKLTASHAASASGLAALAAALEAKGTGTPLDPTLAARIGDVVKAFGYHTALDALTTEEARLYLFELRQSLRIDGLLTAQSTRATSWSYSDPQLLQDVGEFSRSHGVMVAHKLVPALDGLAHRLAIPGARFLDVGVGVAGTAIALAQQLPNIQIVGIDVWGPSLALARDNVAREGLTDRIELREQGAENLTEESVYEAVWLPSVFMPERIFPAAVERTYHALRPGGWVLVPFLDFSGLDALPTAVWRLRSTMFGGPQWTADEFAQLLRDKGFAQVRLMPKHPAVPAGFVVGQRA